MKIIINTKIYIILLSIGMHLISQPLSDNEIILTPINTAYLFDNFYDSLNPFMHSIKN